MPVPSRRRTASKRALNREATRARILAAAEQLFFNPGYASTSLRALLGRADVSTEAFYALFESKDAVAVALVEELGELIEKAMVGGFLAEADPWHGIEESAVAAGQAMQKRHRLARLVLGGAPGAGPSVQRAVAKSYRRLTMLMASAFAREVRKQRLADFQPELAAETCVGAFNHHIARWVVRGDLRARDLVPTLRLTARLLAQGLARR
jgi:AcrR family transcriptional regulator